ncbi:hypothetical protein [Novipirellula rosea]|uniref:Uncharacterized protein n=1 Tax=Novipirellula rosea TaxID=1031540 RepID=A0ABP8N7W1_9BACT
MESSHGIDFVYDGGPVGVLDPETLPASDGVVSYMPYRSGSHWALHQAISAGDAPECTCVKDGVEYSFFVDSCPEYGRLAVRDIRTA